MNQKQSVKMLNYQYDYIRKRWRWIRKNTDNEIAQIEKYEVLPT